MFGLPRSTVALTIGFFAAACTNIATSSPAQSPSASAFVTQTFATSGAPSSDGAASATAPVATSATRPPKPPKTSRPRTSATPAAPTGPVEPNLVVTKVTTDLDRFVVDQPAAARVTIKNTGTADAPSFELGLTFSVGATGGGGALRSVTVDGL